MSGGVQKDNIRQCVSFSTRKDIDSSVSRVSPHTSLSACAHKLAALSAEGQLRHLVELGAALPDLPLSERTLDTQVMGCTARVWLRVARGSGGTVSLAAASNSAVSAGLAAVLVAAFDGAPIDVVADFDGAAALDALPLPPVLRAQGRVGAFRNMAAALQKRARALRGDLPKFPSLLVTAEELTPLGAFAVAQARFLRPDAAEAAALAQLLRERRIGVVAHFYMDPEVQGVLAAAAKEWPHIHVSDSLVMADRAVAMAAAGCCAIAVLGVDFMSENVRAVLDASGHDAVAVYRMAPARIGCSLADAAESEAYLDYLRAGAEGPASGVAAEEHRASGGSVPVASASGQRPRNLHVVYINTSLQTKAAADAVMPTITCTSGNVVQTLLQAFAQVPDLHVWYGPDTYMGRNLQSLFASIARLPNADVEALHPSHSAATVAAALPRLHAFQDGTCIVHEIFGADTADAVRRGYGDAHITAHLEVPGEMFALAVEAKRDRGMGVVGSTSDILKYIIGRVEDAVARGFRDRLQFVLGTETGMVTSIVNAVQAHLRGVRQLGLEVEIVFPVATPDAVTTEATAAAASTSAGAAPAALPGGLSIVPGPAGGEGCSAEGGCAACPYMKMNTLAALRAVCERIGRPGGEAMLEAYRPKAYQDTIGGRTIAEAGCRPILHMRHFQQTGRLPDELVQEVEARSA